MPLTLRKNLASIGFNFVNISNCSKVHDFTIAGNVRGTHASSGAGSEPIALSIILIIRHMTHEVIMFNQTWIIKAFSWFTCEECIPVRKYL